MARIRTAKKDDVDVIQQVARRSWHAAYASALGEEWVDEKVDSWYDPERLITDDITQSERPFFVAVVDDTVVGFVEAVPDETDNRTAHLYRIYVAPDHWGDGIGSSLLNHIEALLAGQGFEQLQLSVLAVNDVGIQFYEPNDFDQRSTIHNDQLDVKEYRYVKEL